MVFAGFGDGGGLVHREEFVVAHYDAAADYYCFDIRGF